MVSALNETAACKRVLSAYLRTFAAWWIHKATEKVIHVDGLERLQTMRPEGGVIVAANHRSFFDFYVIASLLLRKTRLAERLYFPVRAEFFYESALGFLVNGVVGGFAMYPPIFRQQARRRLNEIGLRRIEALLRERGVLVGIHPEGRRGTGPNPYDLLPAQPGIARTLYKTRVPAIPVFVCGLTNKFLHQLVNGIRGRVDRVYVVFGDPVPLDDLYAQPGRPSTYLGIANRVRSAIIELGQRAKRLDEAQRPEG